LLRRGGRGQNLQLASLRASRLFRHPDRRFHRLLHLHRLRLGFHRRGGMPPPAARFARRWS
jgi:hypothetical protein